RVLAVAVLDHRRASALHELIQRPPRLGDADNQAIQSAPPPPSPGGQGRSSCKRGRRLRQRTRGRPSAASPCGYFLFSTCPPKPKRVPESTLFWNRSRFREAKRRKSAAVRTSAGTSSSFAAPTGPPTLARIGNGAAEGGRYDAGCRLAE